MQMPKAILMQMGLNGQNSDSAYDGHAHIQLPFHPHKVHIPFRWQYILSAFQVGVLVDPSTRLLPFAFDVSENELIALFLSLSFTISALLSSTSRLARIPSSCNAPSDHKFSFCSIEGFKYFRFALSRFSRYVFYASETNKFTAC